MTSMKTQEPLRRGEQIVPVPEDELLVFMTPGSDPDQPTWVTYPGDTAPLIGKVVLRGPNDQLLVQPPAGDLLCLRGRPVRLALMYTSAMLRKHMERYRPSIHSRDKAAAIRLATGLLVANRRPADAPADSFMEFVVCGQRCGFVVNDKLVRLEEGQGLSGDAFYVDVMTGVPIMKFIQQSGCLHSQPHPS